MLSVLSLTAFAGLLIYAACSDVARLIIPNWVSIAMTALFPPAALALGMPLGEIGVHLLFGLGVLVVGFFLFQANVIGGGDAKLLAATAVWTGFLGFAPFILWTAVAGGALALAVLAARQWVPESALWPKFVNRLLQPSGGVPYAVAIMTGGLMAIPSLTYLSAPLTLP